MSCGLSTHLEIRISIDLVVMLLTKHIYWHNMYSYQVKSFIYTIKTQLKYICIYICLLIDKLEDPQG